jgi:hypothetical protein
MLGLNSDRQPSQKVEPESPTRFNKPKTDKHLTVYWTLAPMASCGYFLRSCFVYSRFKDRLVIELKISEKHIRAQTWEYNPFH